MKTQKLLSNLEIAAFCEQTALVISAGIPAYEGLSILLADAADSKTENLLRQIYEPLEQGSSLHSALAATQAFPSYVLNMVELGELSGKLDDVLESLHTYYEREEHIQNSIKNAITYPLLMIGIMFFTAFILIIEVLPVFEQLSIELGLELTGFPRFMMHISNTLHSYGAAILISFALLIIIIFFYTKTNSFRLFIQRRHLSLSAASSRFANCMAMAISSGMDFRQGLALAEHLADNPYMKARIQTCQELVEKGFSFDDAILSTKLFTKTYASLLHIGFRTGNLEKIMNRIYEEYENENDYEIHKFVSYLEPALVIILTIFVGFILLTFLLPFLVIMTGIA